MVCSSGTWCYMSFIWTNSFRVFGSDNSSRPFSNFQEPFTECLMTFRHCCFNVGTTGYFEYSECFKYWYVVSDCDDFFLLFDASLIGKVNKKFCIVLKIFHGDNRQDSITIFTNWKRRKISEIYLILYKLIMIKIFYQTGWIKLYY